MTPTTKLTKAQRLTAELMAAHRVERKELGKRVARSIAELNASSKDKNIVEGAKNIQYLFDNMDIVYSAIFECGVQAGLFPDGQNMNEEAAAIVVLSNLLPYIFCSMVMYASAQNAEYKLKSAPAYVDDDMKEILRLTAAATSLEQVKDAMNDPLNLFAKELAKRADKLH